MNSNVEKVTTSLPSDQIRRKRGLRKGVGCFFIGIGVILLFFVICGLFVKFKQSAVNNTIEMLVDEVNSTCPQHIENGLVIKSAAYDKRSFIYLIETPDAIWRNIDVSAAKKNIANSLMEMMKSDISNYDFLDVLSINQKSLTYRYINSNNKNKDVVLSNRELSDLQTAYVKGLR